MLNVKITALEPLFTLDEAKAYLRVTSNDEDGTIETLSDGAVTGCLNYCNIPLVPREDKAEAAFKAAALIYLGTLYDDRTAVIVSGSSVANMIDPYRWLRA